MITIAFELFSPDPNFIYLKVLQNGFNSFSPMEPLVPLCPVLLKNFAQNTKNVLEVGLADIG